MARVINSILHCVQGPRLYFLGLSARSMLWSNSVFCYQNIYGQVYLVISNTSIPKMLQHAVMIADIVHPLGLYIVQSLKPQYSNLCYSWFNEWFKFQSFHNFCVIHDSTLDLNVKASMFFYYPFKKCVESDFFFCLLSP